MTTHRSEDDLDPRTTADIHRLQCCGPYRDGAPILLQQLAWGDTPGWVQWVCVFHQGYDTALKEHAQHYCE